MERFEIPILFLTYHRLDTTQKAFEQIRKIRPARLYLASDGPKKDNPADKEKVDGVRAWMDAAIDWDCDVHRRYSEVNQGCQKGVSSAIDWIFETEEQAIILEDDIVAETSFFLFCREMLDRYRDDDRVMAISGYKRCWDFAVEGDYFFSHFGSVWGWATWRRAWRYFDVTMEQWPACRENGLMENLFWGAAVPSLKDEFDAVWEGRLDSWAYPWDLARYLNSGLSVLPRVNLTVNVGFVGEESTHTNKNDRENIPVGELRFPLKPEKFVLRNWAYDREYERRFFRRNTFRKFVRKHAPKAILRKWYHFRGVKGY